MKIVSTMLCAAALMLAGCSAAPASDPEPEPTETGPVPALTLEGAEQVLADYDERNNAVALEVAATRDGTLWAAVDAGPVLLSAQFNTIGYERLDQDQPTGPWQRTVDRVWAPELGEHPLYALVTYDVADIPTEESADKPTDEPTSEPTDESPDEPTAEIDWVNLGVWVQDSDASHWLSFARTWVDQARLSPAATVPLTEELAAPHRDAAQHLLAYLKGKDVPEVIPDDQLRDYLAGANIDDEITRRLDAALFSNSSQQIGPGGSVFPVQTEDGPLGVAVLRVYSHMSVGEGRYITLDNDDLRIALGLSERSSRVVYKYAVTIAYLLGEDGTVEVIGSDFSHIE